MEVIIFKAVKNMSLTERYRLKMLLKELFEEKEVVYINTHAFGRVSMLEWHYKTPYQVFLCNEHKEVEITTYGCHVCASNTKRNKDKLAKEKEEEEKQLDEQCQKDWENLLE
jgi:hypothetical protein